MTLKEFWRGRWGVVAFIVHDDGSCPISEFFAGPGAKEAAKMAALFSRYADFGYITNRLHFKKLASDLFEFKGHQARLLCFPEGRTMVVVHGVIKKKDDLATADIAKATRIRDEYLKQQRKK